MGAARHVSLQALRERIRAIEQRRAVPARSDALLAEPPGDPVRATGWAEIDAALGGGLAAGGLHEWFGVEAADGNGECVTSHGNGPGQSMGGQPRGANGRWTPPICILVHLAWQAARQAPSMRWTLWIGRSCHPYPRVLARDRGRDRRLLEHSLFVAPREAASRLWAIELALRSPAVGCVVGDGSGFGRAATQRIQLLARDQSKWALIARPPPECDRLSAAQSRWRVRSEPLSPAGRSVTGVQPRWSMELLRCKGVRPTGDHRGWLLEWNRDTGAVDLSAPLSDLAGAPTSRRAIVAEPVPRQSKTA